MFAGKHYIINAQALTDSLLLTVSKAAVLSEIERDSRFAMRMLAGISRRLHGLVHDVEAYALHSGLQRVIGYLLRDLPEDAALPASMTGPAAAVRRCAEMTQARHVRFDCRCQSARRPSPRGFR
jgi:hypothetical protein